MAGVMEERDVSESEAQRAASAGDVPERPFDPKRFMNGVLNDSYEPTEEEWEKFDAWYRVEMPVLNHRITRNIEGLRRLAGRR